MGDLGQAHACVEDLWLVARPSLARLATDFGAEQVIQALELFIELCQTLPKIKELIVCEANHEGLVVGGALLDLVGVP